MAAYKPISILSLLKEVEKSEGRSIMITIPSSTSWEEYEKELSRVENGRGSIDFMVGQFPKGVKVGSRCYLVHLGNVVGWMAISGFTEKTVKGPNGNEFNGKFIERSGPFHYLKEKIPMRGFIGFRYFSPFIDENLYNAETI